MRFQVPALAIGLFASLALSQSDSLKVRIETLFDGPGDDATSICALQLSGVCKSGAPTTTEKFATFNEESGLCENISAPPELEICQDEEGSHNAISIQGQQDGNIALLYEGSVPWDDNLMLECDLGLSAGSECTLRSPQ